MLRCEDSSDGLHSLGTLQLKSWFPMAIEMLGEGSCVYEQAVNAACALHCWTFRPFSWLPSRLGFVHKMGVKIRALNEVTHGVGIGLKCKMAAEMAASFVFFGQKNISSCQVDHLGQLRVLRSVSCGLGDLRDVFGAGNFTSKQRAQVTTFGLDYAGQHLRRWGMWSFVYMVF